ncbi:MAG: type II toxin-antitoxin system HicA family toxin [Nitrospiraceae bacterium]|nr:type II toxin-antitoxin system HicA family toxin [Nitrospiraceae bacterium]
MPNIPRNLSGSELVKLLAKYGYVVTRQTGSHLRLTTTRSGSEQHLTVPNHSPLKLGTLNNILNDIARHLNIDKQLLIKELFIGK